MVRGYHVKLPMSVPINELRSAIMTLIMLLTELPKRDQSERRKRPPSSADKNALIVPIAISPTY